MKRNKFQNAYSNGLALVKLIEDEIAEVEAAYIKEHGIVNPDGSIPTRVYCIADKAVFDAANEATAAIIERRRLNTELVKLKEALRIAEDNVIEYGLSIIPPGMRSEKFNEAVKTDYTTRQKFLDMVYKLDVSTIPKDLKF